jgi:ribosomal protein S18 acetylase RimI-like enzyme
MRLEVSCRPVTPADEPFLRQLFERVRTHIFCDLPLDAEQKKVLIDLQYRAQAGHYAVAYPEASDSILEIDGNAIGRMTVCHLADEIRLVEIAVDPAYQNEGVGSAAIRQLIDAATVAGKPIVLHVDQANPARRLYERLGFCDIGDEGLYRVMSWRPAG